MSTDEQFRRAKIERVGDEVARKHFAVGVVSHHGIVVGLAREGDFVFRRGQFLGELHHVLIRLQVGILLADHHQAAQRAAQAGFRGRQIFHRSGIAGIGGGGFRRGVGDVARGGDGFQRAALVRHVALGRLDQIRNQVVAALELHVNLRVGVFVAVAHRDELVVNAHDHHADDDDHHEQSAEQRAGNQAQRERCRFRQYNCSCHIFPFVKFTDSFTEPRRRAMIISAQNWNRSIADGHHHGTTSTGMPIQTSFTRYSASQFASRKQPCDSVRPICSGLGVPCMP